MSRPPTTNLDAVLLTEEQQEQIMAKLTQIIDCLSETAVEILVDFVNKPVCKTAESIMVKQPEILAARALQEAFNQWSQARSRPPDVSLH